MFGSFRLFLTVLFISLIFSSCLPRTANDSQELAPPLAPETKIIPRDSRLIGDRQLGIFVPEAAWKASKNVLPLEAELNMEFDIV